MIEAPVEYSYRLTDDEFNELMAVVAFKTPGSALTSGWFWGVVVAILLAAYHGLERAYPGFSLHLLIAAAIGFILAFGLEWWLTRNVARGVTTSNMFTLETRAALSDEGIEEATDLSHQKWAWGAMERIETAEGMIVLVLGGQFVAVPLRVLPSGLTEDEVLRRIGIWKALA